jgi:hypothetical protein
MKTVEFTAYTDECGTLTSKKYRVCFDTHRPTHENVMAACKAFAMRRIVEQPVKKHRENWDVKSVRLAYGKLEKPEVHHLWQTQTLMPSTLGYDILKCMVCGVSARRYDDTIIVDLPRRG